MYTTSKLDEMFSTRAGREPPPYEDIGQYSPGRTGPPPIPPRAAELGRTPYKEISDMERMNRMTSGLDFTSDLDRNHDLDLTDLNDNCKINNRPPLVRIPTITITSAPSTPEVLDNDVICQSDGHVTEHDHVTQKNWTNENANVVVNVEDVDNSDEVFILDERQPGDGEENETRDADGTDSQLNPNIYASMEKRVSWSGEYIEGQRNDSTQLQRPHRHHRHHHRRKLSSAYAKAALGHSLTFPPAYEEFAQYASYQNGTLFNPADLSDEGDETFSSKKTCNIQQQNVKKKETGDKYHYSLSHRKEEVPSRVHVTLQRLPPPSQLYLAASQPKEVAQYQRKDWTEDEFILETPVCGIISIVSHVGALVWFAVLIWQLRMRDIFEAQKWETIGNGWYTRRVDFTEEFDKTMLIIAGVFLGLSYATILFETMSSYAETYLSNFMSFQEAMDHVRHVRRIPSKITWRLECFIQDELNPMPSYTKLEDGQAVTKARKKTRHTRHWVTYTLPVTRCIDASGEIKGFRPGVVSRVEFSKTFGFIDEKAAMQYEILKREFLSRHPNRVPDAKVEETLEIEGFKDRVTVFFQSDGRPPCMRKRYFWFCTFLLLGWPYRWWFRKNTEKCRFTYVKLVELGDFVDG